MTHDCVLLLNGSFVQTAASVRYDADEPLYVTVLPLDATYLPYTVELIDGKTVSPTPLVTCSDMGEGHRLIELALRSAYVYSPSASAVPPPPPGALAQLLSFVHSGNFAAARAMMSPELSDSVTDSALADFFDGVVSVRENIYTSEGGYLLVRNDGTAARCEITVRGGLIENIVM